MDEPSSSLTAKEIDDLYPYHPKAEGRRRGIVYISHNWKNCPHIWTVVYHHARCNTKQTVISKK